MAAFLTDLTAAFTKILACVGETATAITGSPFLLFTVIFLFAGGVIAVSYTHLDVYKRQVSSVSWAVSCPGIEEVGRSRPEMAPAGGVFLWRYLHV